jgi:hypothetical protein
MNAHSSIIGAVDGVFQRKLNSRCAASVWIRSPRGNPSCAIA